MPTELTQSFTNSARRLYLAGTATPTAFTLIPSTKLEESVTSGEEKWFSSSDVVGGVPYENGVVTAQAQMYDFECTMEQGTGATPAMAVGLAIIAGCKNKIGTDVRYLGVIVEADGSMNQAYYDVMHVATSKGDQSKAARISCKLVRRGASSPFSGSLSGGS
jgi:hypothetical protein